MVGESTTQSGGLANTQWAETYTRYAEDKLVHESSAGIILGKFKEFHAHALARPQLYVPIRYASTYVLSRVSTVWCPSKVIYFSDSPRKYIATSHPDSSRSNQRAFLATHLLLFEQVFVLYLFYYFTTLLTLKQTNNALR